MSIEIDNLASVLDYKLATLSLDTNVIGKYREYLKIVDADKNYESAKEEIGFTNKKGLE